MLPASETRPEQDHHVGTARRLRKRAGAGLEYLWELSGSLRHRTLETLLVDGTEPETGVPLRILYVGQFDNYAFTVGRMLTDHRMVERRTGISAFRVGSCFKDSIERAAILVMDVELLYGTMLRRQPFMRIPAWVRQKYSVPGTWHEVLQSFRTNTRRTDLRKIRKYALKYRISRSEDDFREFYHRMYVPYLKKRFDREVIIEPEWKVLRQCRKGELMHVVRGGQVVACALLHRGEGRLAYVWVGVPDGLEDDLYRGAFSALYYFSILYAYERGCSEVDFLGSRPLLDDGLFRYKRKWGTRVEDSPVPRGDILIRPLRFDASVRSTFRRLQYIVRDGAGLAGRILLDDGPASSEDLKRILVRDQTPGLDRLQVFSLHGFDEEALRWVEAEKPPLALHSLEGDPDPATTFSV
jgi:hypothetical protein